MIRFNCAHCGWPVKVANICAGKKGRCPSCKGIVGIPHYSMPAAGDSAALSRDELAASEMSDTSLPRLEDLAAAVESLEDSLADRPPPPPPMTAQDSFIEEFERETHDPDAAEETDIIPTDQITQPPADARPRERRGVFSVTKPSPHSTPAHDGTHPPARGGLTRRPRRRGTPTLEDIRELNRRMRIFVLIAVVSMVLIVLTVAGVLLYIRKR